MTHIFQPIDLTVNGAAKYSLKVKFIEWFAKKIDECLQEGKELEDIEAKFGLTTLNPYMLVGYVIFMIILLQARVRS